jgi:integrase
MGVSIVRRLDAVKNADKADYRKKYYIFRYRQNGKDARAERDAKLFEWVANKKKLTQSQKEHNKEAEFVAEQRLQNEKARLYRNEYDVDTTKKRYILFEDYFNEYTRLHSPKIKKKSINSYLSARDWFVKWSKKRKSLHEITRKDAMEFQAYLTNDALSKFGRPFDQSTIKTYLNRLRLVLDEAVSERYLRSNPFEGLDVAIEIKRKKREYITLEEYALLDEELCRNPNVARAFKLGFLTGLRSVDIEKLMWKDLVKDENGWHVYTKQEKTGALIRIAINNEARELLGKRRIDEMPLVPYKYSGNSNSILYEWLRVCGIKKLLGQRNGGITFHTSRASFITNHLNNGTPPVVVMQLAGHSDLKRTMDYYRDYNIDRERWAKEYETYINRASATKKLLETS